ncbi:MAG: hypothetical protein M2R45_00184 [Verrucomicrobia subdivision 3 bacterium]|nr:hypothetical protein [Limisphaerales bacterium]MCS1412357.1 hypothetical protein [Limisphaerales bacterium]
MNQPAWWIQAEADLNQNVIKFADELRKKLEEFDPKVVIKRKNPYLFCLRDTSGVESFSSSILEAFLSSSEETMFGNLAEKCAVAICKNAKNGMKSTGEGIDLEYANGNVRTIIRVKSGMNWGNSSQRKKMKEYFTKAKRILGQGANADNHIKCIEGICYGPASKKNKGDFHTYIGSDFWEEIIDWNGTYMALLDIFSKHAANGLQEIKQAAKDKITRFLIDNEISLGNKIHWANLVRYVNGR